MQMREQTKPGAKLDIEKINHQLAQSAIGHTIFHFESVSSTMAIAHELAKDSTVRSGAIVVAEEQSAGRGRLGRQWQSPIGTSLLMSLLLRTESLPQNLSHLMMIAGIATVEALSTIVPKLDGKCGLKWPNDILLGNRQGNISDSLPSDSLHSDSLPSDALLKTGGVLIEFRYTGAQLSHAVVGIGINVNQQKEDLPALQAGATIPTSIATFSGESCDRTALFIALARRWEHLLTQARDEPHRMLAEWRKHLWTLHQEVIITDPAAQSIDSTGQTTNDVICSDVICSGVAFDVQNDGSLLIRDAQGVIHTIHAGDVSLRNRETTNVVAASKDKFRNSE